MENSMKLLILFSVTSQYILLSECQTARLNTETYQEFLKRCQKVIQEKFVRNKFPNVYAQQFTSTVRNKGDLVLPKFTASFNDEGKPGNLYLNNGKFEAGNILNNGFVKDQSQFTYRFIIPVVNCTYSYNFEQAGITGISGHVYVHVLDVVLSLSSSTQLYGGNCAISTPTMKMIVNPKNYLIKFLHEPVTRPVIVKVTERVLNSFFGTHLTPIINTLRTLLIPLMVKTVWPNALKEAKPQFETLIKPQNPGGILCYAITNLATSPRIRQLNEQKCPDV